MPYVTNIKHKYESIYGMFVDVITFDFTHI